MEFEFEELMADMLGVSDEDRDDPEAVPDAVLERFGIDMEEAYKFAAALLERTPVVTAGLTQKQYHAFVDKDHQAMLMKVEA